MQKPIIAWMPVRHIHAIVEGRMRLEEWLKSVRQFGLNAVELYHDFLNEENLAPIKALLDQLGLRVSQITCAPDFTNPDPQIRQREQARMRQRVDWAHQLGANAVRVTAGMQHPELSETDGIRYAVDEMRKLAEYAVPLGVYPCYENHYRDRRWDKEDFSFPVEGFLKIFEVIEPTDIRINFDFANPLMTGSDPVALLQRVVHKVHHVHAGDRKVGEYPHSVLGEGQVPFRPLLTLLHQREYTGYLSIEDGQSEGDAGFRRSVALLQREVDIVWGG